MIVIAPRCVSRVQRYILHSEREDVRILLRGILSLPKCFPIIILFVCVRWRDSSVSMPCTRPMPLASVKHLEMHQLSIKDVLCDCLESRFKTFLPQLVNDSIVVTDQRNAVYQQCCVILRWTALNDVASLLE